MGREGGKRRDARANRQAVIDAAMALLAEDPDVGMAAIAERTGLGRTTVYRHFPNRERLFEGLVEEVLVKGNAELEEAVARDSGSGAVLRAIAEVNVEYGMRYRFLFVHQGVTKPAMQRAGRDGNDVVTEYLAAARERGEVRSDQPLRWLVATQLAISLAMIGDLLAGRIEREDAAALLGETLIAMMEPRR